MRELSNPEYPQRHPGIQTDSPLAGCRVGMLRKTDFGRSIDKNYLISF